MKPITTGVLLMGDLPAKNLASLSRRLEDWGYDYIWLADERFFREIYSSLPLCALNTKKIQLGVCVTDPYSRHPALTAMATPLWTRSPREEPSWASARAYQALVSWESTGPGRPWP